MNTADVTKEVEKSGNTPTMACLESAHSDEDPSERNLIFDRFMTHYECVFVISLKRVKMSGGRLWGKENAILTLEFIDFKPIACIWIKAKLKMKVFATPEILFKAFVVVKIEVNHSIEREYIQILVMKVIINFFSTCTYRLTVQSCIILANRWLDNPISCLLFLNLICQCALEKHILMILINAVHLWHIIMLVGCRH